MFGALVCIEGVLLHPKPDYAASVPIDSGRRLYEMLSEHHTAPTTLLSAYTDPKMVKAWLQMNRVRFSNLITAEETPADLDEYFAAQAIRYRVGQGRLEWFVTAHPRAAAHARARGITTLLFMHHAYAVPIEQTPPKDLAWQKLSGRSNLTRPWGFPTTEEDE